MKNKLSLDEVLDSIESLRSLVTFGYSSKDLNFALDEIIEIIENQKIMKNDILHYGSYMNGIEILKKYGAPEKDAREGARGNDNKESAPEKDAEGGAPGNDAEECAPEKDAGECAPVTPEDVDECFDDIDELELRMAESGLEF